MNPDIFIFYSRQPVRGDSLGDDAVLHRGLSGRLPGRHVQVPDSSSHLFHRNPAPADISIPVIDASFPQVLCDQCFGSGMLYPDPWSKKIEHRIKKIGSCKCFLANNDESENKKNVLLKNPYKFSSVFTSDTSRNRINFCFFTSRRRILILLASHNADPKHCIYV